MKNVMFSMITLGILAASAVPGSACGVVGQPPCFQAPRPPITMNTMGNQTFITQPGYPTTTMQTMGNSTFINTPGRPTRVCNTLGTMTFCN